MNKFTKSFVMIVTLLLLTACSVDEEKEVMDTKEQIYQQAKSFYAANDYESALDNFTKIQDYKDSADRMNACKYSLALSDKENGKYDSAITLLTSLDGYENAGDILIECYYLKIQQLIEQGQFTECRKVIAELGKKQDTSKIQQYCDYMEGIYLFKQKKYSDAVKRLLGCIGYNDSNARLISIAKIMINKKEYEIAQKICDKLDGEQGVASLQKKIILKNKYAKYKKYIPSLKKYGYDSYITYDKKEAEEYLKENIYGVWKDYYTGKPYVIDKYFRDGKAYGIYSIYSEDIGWGHIYYYYQNNPNKIYCEAYHVAGMTSEGGGISIPFLESSEEDGYAYKDYTYARMDEEEVYDKLNKIEREYKKKETARAKSKGTKKKIYEDMKSAFETRYNVDSLMNHTFSFTNTTYQDMDSMEYSYNSSDNTYTVSLYVDVESNIFDLRNKYTTRYTIDAKYSYNDGSISRIEFSYY